MSDNNNTDDVLIQRLAADLNPAQRLADIYRVAWLWLLISLLYVALTTLLLGPLRGGAWQQLAGHPRFALEMLSGLAAMSCFAIAAFCQSVPGITTTWWLRAAWGLCVLWLVQIVAGFAWPVLEPSMLGKRDHCALEFYFYVVPPVLAAVWLQMRRFALQPVHAAVNAAIAAGMMPAIGMQVACMYEPGHILRFHAAPIVSVAALVGLLVYVLVRRQPADSV